MIKCGNEHEISSNIQWYLKPVDDGIQSDNVTFYVDVTNVINRNIDGSTHSKRTTINAEILIPIDQAQVYILSIYEIVLCVSYNFNFMFVFQLSQKMPRGIFINQYKDTDNLLS